MGRNLKIGDVTKDEFDRVWEIAKELAKLEGAFNTLQGEYRRQASTWLLAVFGGVGFVITNKGHLPFDADLFIAFIGLAGTIGILQLWNLDLRVYQCLLDAVFIEGLQLEEDYPWLPTIRRNMMLSQKNKGVTSRVRWFYMAGVSVPLSISGIALTVFGYKSGLSGSLTVLGVASAALIALNAYLHRSTPNTDDLIDLKQRAYGHDPSVLVSADLNESKNEDGAAR